VAIVTPISDSVDVIPVRIIATCQVIIMIAHLLCDPLGCWSHFHPRQRHRPTVTTVLIGPGPPDRKSFITVYGDPLLPGIYEFKPTRPIIL
jgi:hypothetical protein